MITGDKGAVQTAAASLNGDLTFWSGCTSRSSIFSASPRFGDRFDYLTGFWRRQAKELLVDG